MSLLENGNLRIRHFATDARAAVTVELVLVLPMLIWAFFATMIFNDAYRARSQAQAAALHVADAMSRNTTIVTQDYLEGMNDVYDFLIAGAQASRLRVTSVAWDREADQPIVLWSYGTRGMNALPENAFQLLASDDLGALRELMDGEDGTDLVVGFTQMPNTDLHTRIPPVMPGEALILVESFTMWETPLRGVFLGFDILDDTRLSPVAVVRPRFSPFINFEGAINAAPADAHEYDGLPVDPVADPDPDPVTDPDSLFDDANAVDIVDNDFTSGDTTGWSQDRITDTNTASLGSMLGPFGGETRRNPVTYSVDLGGRTQGAVIEFDLFVIDSWDGYGTQWSPPEGDYLMLQVDGESIALESFQHAESLPQFYRHDRRTVANLPQGRFTTMKELVSYGTNVWGNSRWTDQIWRVRIEIEDPAPDFVLGFAAQLDSAIGDEAFGILNMRIRTFGSGQALPRFAPDDSARAGRDTITEFATYDGCPEHRLAAQTMVLANSDLENGAIRFRRNVGGATRLQSCTGYDHVGYLNASPTITLDYTNDTNNLNSNRLRLRTDDGNDGRSCDATLLVRDPNGQVQFQDDLPGYGWNAGLDLGHPQDGLYTFWLGTYGGGTCATDIIFEFG